MSDDRDGGVASSSPDAVGVLDAPVVSNAVSEEEPQKAPKRRWSVSIAVTGEPLPESFAPYAVDLDRPLVLVGRGDEARGVLPEIALAHDEAVSRRHALLMVDAAREVAVQVRDIGSSNGTRLNGVELTPLTDYPVRDGDVIELGYRSQLQVRCEPQ